MGAPDPIWMTKVGSRSLRTTQSRRKWGPKPHEGWLRGGPAWRGWARGRLHRNALSGPLHGKALAA
eukprot:370071-Alexandrium_andersonii.AAC.1